MSAISESLGIHRTSVTPHTKALIEAGDVTAEPDPEDGRSRILFPANARREPSKPLGPARKGAADRVDRSGKEADNSLLALVREAGTAGITAKAIAEQLGIGIASVRGKLGQFTHRGVVVVSLDDEPLYRTGEIGMMPADGDGCKTETERKLVAAVKAAPVPPTINEVAANAGIRGNGIGAVLQGLVRRGVLKTLPRDHDQQPNRYEVATG